MYNIIIIIIGMWRKYLLVESSAMFNHATRRRGISGVSTYVYLYIIII